MTVHNFRICKAIIKEAKWEVLTKEDMDHLRKQNVALFWLLTWARGATFRKFAIERGKLFKTNASALCLESIGHIRQ